MRFQFLLYLLILKFNLFSQQNGNFEVDTAKLYFPVKCLYDTINLFGQEKNEIFYQRRFQSAIDKDIWFSEKLINLKEPKLYKNYQYESYRFIWFGYLKGKNNPFALRIENRNDTILLFVKYIYHDKKNREFGGDTIVLTKNDWNTFKTKVKSIDFWNLPCVEKSKIIVMDGSTCIMEGKKGNEYNMVYSKRSELKEIIKEPWLFLIEKSGLKIK